MNHLGAGGGCAKGADEMGEWGRRLEGGGGRGSKGFGIALPGWGFYQGKKEIKEVAAISPTPSPGLRTPLPLPCSVAPTGQAARLHSR